ncbi:hypothetical protein SteCoe_5690 [Stentor coeruleus]|uniref:Uncharacterized protein n=1 Tax=Stentor coeruleus TaxID=5963 RepID=A0A1R2CRR1_9CILI|nr:hypothetical protein SteCoe_5690 [Stentor coeruleus]
MESNEICKKLVEDCIKNSRVPDYKRYAAHFEYQDLVNKLLQIQSSNPNPNHTQTLIVSKVTKICVKSPVTIQVGSKTCKTETKNSVSPLLKTNRLIEVKNKEKVPTKAQIGCARSVSRQSSGFSLQQQLQSHKKSSSHHLISSFKQLSVVRVIKKK